MLIPTTIKSRRLVTAQNPKSESDILILWQKLKWQKNLVSMENFLLLSALGKSLPFELTSAMLFLKGFQG
jgi:hypothetical protein